MQSRVNQPRNAWRFWKGRIINYRAFLEFQTTNPNHQPKPLMGPCLPPLPFWTFPSELRSLQIINEDDPACCPPSEYLASYVWSPRNDGMTAVVTEMIRPRPPYHPPPHGGVPQNRMIQPNSCRKQFPKPIVGSMKSTSVVSLPTVFPRCFPGNHAPVAVCSSLSWYYHDWGDSSWLVKCSQSLSLYEGFLKWGYPLVIHFNGIFCYKPSIFGYPHVWNPPYLPWLGIKGKPPPNWNNRIDIGPTGRPAEVYLAIRPFLAIRHHLRCWDAGCYGMVGLSRSYPIWSPLDAMIVKAIGADKCQYFCLWWLALWVDKQRNDMGWRLNIGRLVRQPEKWAQEIWCGCFYLWGLVPLAFLTCCWQTAFECSW